MAQITQGDGNTKHRPTKGRLWFFTLNNYLDTDILEILGEVDGDSYQIQKEIGSNGTPHLQGYVGFKNARGFEALKKWCGGRIHWERCRNKKASIAYCSKLETSVGESWTSKDLQKKVIKDPVKEYRDWQKEVVEFLEGEPDDRKILWIVDKEGGKGKTALCKHLVLKRGALYVTGRSNDVKCSIALLDEEKKDIPNIMLFDFTRSVENYVSYQAIEEVKNGLFFCGKYKSKQVVFDCPHVVCFSNFEPEQGQLSRDRWLIKRI